MTGLVANYSTNEEDTDTHWAPSTTFTVGGLVLTHAPDEFRIGNDSIGATQGYSIDISSAVEGGDFIYDGNNHPTEGTIGSIQVYDSTLTNTYFSISFPEDVGDGNKDLGAFWSTLESSGAKAALDQLIGDG